MYDNRLGIKGNFYAGKFGIERYLYSLHRISGLGLIIYLLLHIVVTSFRLGGFDAWTKVMGTVDNPIFKFGEFLVVVAGVFHGLNGLRLILTEFGYFIGKPERQEYPYKYSTLKQRPLMYFLMILALVGIVISVYDIYLA